MGKIYQIRLWCSDDSYEEFWFDKELSDYFYDETADIKKNHLTLLYENL